jgi:hypothetical protein
MAASKKPSNRSKKAPAKKRSVKKPAAKKAAARKPAARKRAARKPAAKRKAPAKRAAASPTVRKTAPKSGANEFVQAPAAAEAGAAPRTASVAKADATTPSLRPGRQRSYGRWAAVAGLAAAVVVVILLVTGGSDDSDTTVADTSPATTPTIPAETATAPTVTTPPAATPKQPGVRSENCEPIIGSGTQNGGKTYKVTSSATDGDPADCGEAHDTLLSALQGSGTTIGDWTCKTDPSGTTVASCTSTGGRRIQATG